MGKKEKANVKVKIAREKFWEELTSEEKCERLRREVKRRDGIIDRLSRTVSLLEAHGHGDKSAQAVMVTFVDAVEPEYTGRHGESKFF